MGGGVGAVPHQLKNYCKKIPPPRRWKSILYISYNVLRIFKNVLKGHKGPF